MMMYWQDRRFLQFMRYFNETRDYFECHEVLEELWIDTGVRTKKHVLPLLILISTSLYHWRRGNLCGAEKTMRNALKRFDEVEWDEPHIDKTLLYNQCEHALQSIERQMAFRPFVIETDPSLLWRRVTIEEAPEHILLHKHVHVFQKYRKKT